METIRQIMKAQEEYFLAGKSRSVEHRRTALLALQKAIRENEQMLCGALKEDLNKAPFESYMTEIGMVLDEIRFQLKHLSAYARDRRVKTPITQFPAKSFVSPEPYGKVLILAPWNYPIQLCLTPLVGAIAAGNCAVVKPSAYAPASSRAIKKLLEGIFEPAFVTVVEGGREENKALLQEKFDYIFFTGSVAVGKEVMRAAAENLTPVTLELGGKSPCIVEKSANIKEAARRIAFGKIVNEGQTCVEPDYLLLQKGLEEEFLTAYKDTLQKYFPNGDRSEMPRIISEKHFQRLCRLLESGEPAIGGGVDEEKRQIEPTVLMEVAADSPIMQEEIFGPILPVLLYNEVDEAMEFVRRRPKPLALYLFTEDKNVEKQVLESCSFGGGCINDTIIHLAGTNMPFGGVGASGMGCYHGKKSFDTFTHYRSIVKKHWAADLSLREHPYSEKKMKLVKTFMK